MAAERLREDMHTPRPRERDPAQQHHGALLAFVEALEYARSCPEDERAIALHLVERAERLEREARAEWVHRVASSVGSATA